MRIVRAMAVASVVLCGARSAGAQVSCANPANLCTGDPCITTNVTVQSPCVVDFGARALVIGGALTVPSGGMLSFTASTIDVKGRIEAPSATVSLVGTVGDVALRTEVDVGAGSFTATAAGNVDAKTRLKAKGGGTIALDAGGTLSTQSTAVIETAPGGTVVLSGDAGVTVGGKVFLGETASGSLQITSSAGVVAIDQALRASSDPPSTIAIDGMQGVVLRQGITAIGRTGPGGNVTLTSGAGDVDTSGKVGVKGFSGGSVVIAAPAGTVAPLGIYAQGRLDGGSVIVNAAIVRVEQKVVAQGNFGNGGLISLSSSTSTAVGDGLDADGKIDGGTIQMLGGMAGGGIDVDGATLTAVGAGGNGGTVFVSAPTGAVQLRTKAAVTGKGGLGGLVYADGATLEVGPKSRLVADGRTGGGEIRLAQSGAAACLVNGTLQASDGGAIEALAPNADLTVQGKLRTSGGCVGLAAGGALDVADADVDVPITPSCP